MTKNELRIESRAKRSRIEGGDRQLKERLIFQRAHKDRAFQLAPIVHVYCSTPEEVATTMFVEYAWGIGKQVAVPRMMTDNTFESVLVDRSTTWETDHMGISFPTNGDVIEVSDFSSESVAIVPVVAFDSSCNRVGYGRGVYDRFLAAFKGSTVGLAFQVQHTKSIVPEKHDVALDRIATEERWFEA